MSELIPSDAVQAIQDSVETRIIEVEGGRFSTRQIHRIPAREEIEPIRLATLKGLVDYIRLFPSANTFVRIASPTCVRLEKPVVIENSQQIQDVYVVADCSNLTSNGYKTGDYLSQELFIINLMTHYVASDSRANLLAHVGNLEDAKTVRTEDDGVSQTATIKQGIRRVGEGSVGPIVYLAPYRTFREIEQPESAFLFRMRPSQERCVALFEADGNVWKLEAMQRIKTWLEDQDIESPIVC